MKILIHLFLFFSVVSFSQTKQVTVKYISNEIIVDAVLNEEEWQLADKANNFWQYFPLDSIQARNQTEIKFLYNDKTLFVGVKVSAVGNKYVTPSLRRDFRAGNSDNITLMFDTFADGNNAFLFGSNAAGVLREALVSGGGRELRGFTTSWDTKWVGKSKIYDGYYICEWAIPLSAFKYKSGETTWRLNSYKFDTQDNERSTWINIPQNQNIFSLAYMGDMIFEKPLGDSKSPISVIPYVSSSIGKDFETNTSFSEFNVGGDAKFTIGNSLNLDVTIKPDFSQVEVDQQVTNLTRFELNLPERRQFFIENSDLFADFGNSREANPFFSRRIGIASDLDGNTIQNNIIAGARLSGKLNNDFRVGLLTMQTAQDKSNGISANNNSVLALQHNVFKRSNISLLFVNRQQTATNDFVSEQSIYNRVIGLDYNLATVDNTWNGKFFVHKSFTPNVSNNDLSAGLRLNYNSNHWRVNTNMVYVGEQFQSDLGFIPRNDIFKTSVETEYLLFPKKGIINRHNIGFLPIISWRPEQDFKLADYTLINFWNVTFKNNSRFNMRVFNRYTFLFDDFDPSLTDGTPLHANTSYRYLSSELEYKSDGRKSFSYAVNPQYGQFFNGTKFTFKSNVNWRLQPYFNLAFNFRYDAINLPAPYNDNEIWLIGPRFDITFNKSIFWNTFVQYNSLIDNIGLNSRLQWRFSPLSDLFLVYNDNYFTGDDFTPRFRSINLKLTYWLYL